MSCTQVYTWFTRFNLGEKVREIITINANFTLRMLAEELHSSYCTIYTILTEDLGKRKVCARFVPQQLNAPPHKNKKVNAFFMKKQICVIDQPPSSPHLPQYDYFL